MTSHFPPAPTPPRRGPGAGVLLTAIIGAVVVLAVAATVGALALRSSTSDSAFRPPKTWTVTAPADFGDPVAARVAGKVVVVTAQRGVFALSREDGKVLWKQDYRQPFTEWDTEGLNHTIATTEVTIAGDAVIVQKSPPDGAEIFRSTRDVLDLATGKLRFTQLPKTSHVVGWSVAHATTTALIAAECVDGESCELTSYSLKDGSPQWTRSAPGGRYPEFPIWVNEQWETDQSAAVATIAPWRVTDAPGLAMLMDGKNRRATVVNLADGSVVGEWGIGDGGSWTYQVFGDKIVRDGGIGDDTYKGIDPKTGAEIWTYEGLKDSQMLSEFAGAVTSGGLLVDRDTGMRSYRTVDPATGEAGPILGNRGPLLTVTPELAVMGDAVEVTAESPAGQQLWKTPIEQPGGQKYTEWSGSLIAGGKLIFSARADYFGTEGFTWSVNLADGRLTAIGKGTVIGYDDRTLITAAKPADGTYFSLTMRPV
ncbi:hypothetical protein Afil01_57950 [Actinorhabdospora filicis]|uniref:Pyrrolo-quinoline quinone repeat domain-containing protein n=1 Tax=Actinorhabdospora filicis TaxID=1785913 RepID=A0A9W6SRF7_9ACTN|nr:PQQ-binding-like beta-propeller repeat protein [Actinorhabdospora filicis]GLZ80988.1 hypothetical protein Afil01_57950 [Actinorhabdospora filicis]